MLAAGEVRPLLLSRQLIVCPLSSPQHAVKSLRLFTRAGAACSGGILTTAVEQIRSLTDEAILALIGPAICGRCYEVPEHMASESEAAMPGIRARTSWGTPSLDLSAAASTQLRELGVRVLTDPRCTLEDSDLFSYRADSGCGRQALIIIPV